MPSTNSTTPGQQGLLGSFYSLTGTNPQPAKAAGDAFTPWEATADRSPAPPAADIGSLAFGGGNFTQTRAYQMANLPPYNSRRGAGIRSSGYPSSTSVLETIAALLTVGTAAYLVCKHL